MFKAIRIKICIAVSLAVALTLVSFSAGIVAGSEDPFSDIKEKMSVVSEKEKETIQNLFIQAQKIEEMETEGKRLSTDIETLQKEIADLQKTITDEEAAYAKSKESLKQALVSYQRMGPGSYLEILLESNDLPDLVMRINALRDITRNTGSLLDEIRESKERQSTEKAKLSGKLAKVEDDRKQLVQALDKNRQLKTDMENYLASLAEERGYYQGYLDNIQKVWGELKPAFAKAVSDFSAMIENGSIPKDELKMSFDFFSIKVSLEESSLNKIVKEYPQLPEIIFDFRKGRVEMRLPQENLILEGNFVLTDGYSIRFDVDKGSFYGLPLEASAIKGLFQDNYLVLNFKPQLPGFKMSSIEVTDGSLNISIKPE